PLKFKRIDHPLRCENFVVHAVKPEFIPVFVLVGISPHPTASRFEFLKIHHISSWSKPLRVELRVRECLEDELSGCVKLPCNEELLSAGFCRNFCLIHIRSPLRN